MSYVYLMLFSIVSQSHSSQAKNNFDPSVGVIDTSKWSSSNPGPGGNSGNGSPGFLSQQSVAMGPMNPGGPKMMMNPGGMNGLTGNPAGGTPGADWPANMMFGNRVNTGPPTSLPFAHFFPR